MINNRIICSHVYSLLVYSNVLFPNLYAVKVLIILGLLILYSPEQSFYMRPLFS